MSKSIFTEKEKLEYWSKRIKDKAISNLNLLDSELTEMIRHIGREYRPVNDNISEIIKGFDKLMQTLNKVSQDPEKYKIKRQKLKDILKKSKKEVKSGKK